ncbi:MAG: Gldg family protein [Planctomycetes bacterium]|nr:Gldg family protein [Planctomycetota bacterium]
MLLAAPLALVLLALARGERRARGGPRLWPRLAAAAAALAVVAGLAALAPRVELDATRDGRNRLTPDEHATLAELVAAAGGDVRLASAFSPDAALPPELRPLARETRRLADELAHELDGVRHTALVLDADDARAGALGLARHTFGSRDDEARRVQRAYAALVVEAGERREVLELPGARAFAELRFRVAFALARLAGRADARLALVAERPRLSPAEAALEFQQRGLFAPREADPYGELERLLSENDFAVRRVDAVAPHLAEGTRAALFLQPRRDATPLLTALAELLADGGRALLAAQPYALQARQLERADLRLAFWPRPLFEDLDHELLPALGAPLVHEVLLDRPPGSLAVRTRVDAQDGPRYELQESTQPFFVRATPDADAAPLFVGTGELLLPGAARFALDDATLAQRGLSAQVWLRASDAAWSYAWTGGDLPDEALARAEAAGCTRVPGAPLGLWLRGRFPAATRVEGPAAPRTSSSARRATRTARCCCSARASCSATRC